MPPVDEQTPQPQLQPPLTRDLILRQQRLTLMERVLNFEADFALLEQRSADRIAALERELAEARKLIAELQAAGRVRRK